MQDKNIFRCRLAVATGLILARQRISNVYAYDNGMYYNYNATIDNDRISVYDYSIGNYMTGNNRNLFDYSNSSYIAINNRGNSITFYSYHYNLYFSAIINGNLVTIFDYGDGLYHKYRIM